MHYLLNTETPEGEGLTGIETYIHRAVSAGGLVTAQTPQQKYGVREASK